MKVARGVTIKDKREKMGICRERESQRGERKGAAEERRRCERRQIGNRVGGKVAEKY